jgi:hypothetical protein
MRLAEALIERASLVKKFNELQNRIANNVTTQEDELPAESPLDLITEAETTLQRLQRLIQDINRTNSKTLFIDDVSISDAIAARDALKLKHQMYERIATVGSVNNSRYSRTEIKSVSVLHVPEFRKKADVVAKHYRDLDVKIQELNWKTELLTD